MNLLNHFSHISVFLITKKQCCIVCIKISFLLLSLLQAVTLPLSLTDSKWHHLCVTWSTRDGVWEAYQDGVKRGSGENLSPWHPIKPGGVFILGQEQVRVMSITLSA